MSEAAVRMPSRERGNMARGSGGLAKLAARLRNRPDSEHELIFIRLLLSTSVLVYLVAANSLGFLREGLTLWQIELYFCAFLAITILLFCHLLARPGESPLRRLISIPLDLFAFSYIVHIGDASTALLYPVYLWTIFGNGFRYGLPYLFTAAGVGVLAFGTVILTTPFWQLHLSLAGGLLAGLVVLPAYVSLLIRKLSEAKAQAEEASRAKSLFLASVSHELRTPLNAIIGFSDLLSDSPLDDDQADMSQTIGRSGRSLLALINSILDFSRFEAGKMPVTSESIDLYGMLSDIRDMLTVQAQTKGIRLALYIGGGVPRRVRASRRHLEEVLINLAGNAVKFTAEGHVLISVEQIGERQGRASLRFEVTDTGIGIAPEARARIFESFSQADETIIDRFGGTGLGLAIARQQVEAQGGRIGVDSQLGIGSTFWFEIGFAVEPAEAQAIPTNVSVFMLGDDPELAALLDEAGVQVSVFASAEEGTAALAEFPEGRAHRAIIFLDESRIGGVRNSVATGLLGTDSGRMPHLVLVEDGQSPPLTGDLRALFATSLRRPFSSGDVVAALAIASIGTGKRQSAESMHAIKPTSRGLTVLIAEDNRTNQKVIAKILERAGHRAWLVDNGQEAIDALAQQAFDIVLMDVNMPVLNGIEATRRYRAASAGGERIPILALTADATPEANARCLEAGMDGCVTKPIEPARLVELIHEFCPDGPNAAAGEPRMVVTDSPESRNEDAFAPIDLDALAALDKLGGHDFVREIVAQFTGDAATVLRGLSTAVANDDLENFRDRAHALRSCAANVGAQTVYKLCLSWREIDAQEFALHGRDYMMKLETEFELARAALKAHLK